MLYKTALLSAVSISLLSTGSAQETVGETVLDTVTIEGSRLGQTETEIGSSVSIITSDDIEELGFDFALDAIASAPGVTINSNGAFGGLVHNIIEGRWWWTLLFFCGRSCFRCGRHCISSVCLCMYCLLLFVVLYRDIVEYIPNLYQCVYL